MSASNETKRLVDFAGSPSNSTSTNKRYPAYATQEQAVVDNPTSSPSEIGITSAFGIYPGANIPCGDISDNDSTPKAVKLSADDDTRNTAIHLNAIITPTRHRVNSSISMRDVPDFMSAGQILSPHGLPATSKLFENGNEQGYNFSASYSSSGSFDTTTFPLTTSRYTFNEPASTEDTGFSVIIHEPSISKEDFAIGLGITGLKDLDTGHDGVDDVYELGHPGEEGGGTPVKGTKKRRRNVSDVDGEYEAIDHSHFKDIESDRDESIHGGVAVDGECMALDESSDDDDAMGQGGALVEAYEERCLRRQRERESLRRKDMDVISPFPAFDEALASTLHAHEGQYFIMPLRRMSQGTLDYLQRSRR